MNKAPPSADLPLTAAVVPSSDPDLLLDVAAITLMESIVREPVPQTITDLARQLSNALQSVAAGSSSDPE